MPIKEDGHAPYAPPAAVIEVIEAYRDKGLSTPFDNEVLLRAGVSDSLAQRTMQTLKLLDLIDDHGNPTDQFEALRSARGQEQYQERLQEWLKAVYAELLRYADPATDEPERLEEAFRTCAPAGQRNRMVTLMIGLWEHAALREPTSPQKKAAASRRSSAPKTATPKRTKKTKTKAGSPGFAVEGLPSGLVGLLGQIPTNGEGWTGGERQRFVDAFTAVLDFTVPVVTKAGTDDAVDEGDS